MGEYRSVAEFARAIDRLGTTIARPNRNATKDAAVVVGEIIDAEADRSGATSFAGQKRPKYRVYERGNEMFIRPGNVGANVVLNQGARPHIIGARARGTRNFFRQVVGSGSGTGRVSFGRVRTNRKGQQVGAKVLTIGDEFATYANHPGMRGFGFIGRAKKRFPDKALETFHRGKMREILRGTR